MTIEILLKFLSGSFIVIFSSWLFTKTLKDAMKGYVSMFANDIGLYGASLSGVLLGVALIYMAVKEYFF